PVRATVGRARAALRSLADGLELAFKAGAITGLLVAGLALLGFTLYFGFLVGTRHMAPDNRTVIDALVALGFGASLISIFARLGGGISPRGRTWAATSSARSRPAFPRMIRAIPRPSPTMSATMLAIAPGWRPTCSRPTPSRRSLPWCWQRSFFAPPAPTRCSE